nr:terpene synthase 32 [Aquilegia viridiflora]
MAFANSLFSSPFPIVPSHNIQDMTASSKSVTFKQIPSNSFKLQVARPSNKDYIIRHQEKLKEVSQVLRNTQNQLDCMIMIDTLQQFAIDYHFQEEIQDVLRRQYRSLVSDGGIFTVANDNNLCNVSLCFRLLRQNGYPVSSDVFKTYMDKHGKFRQQLTNDLSGMTSLYQASHLGMAGEDILDRAYAFTGKYLRDSMPHVGPDQACVITDTLDHPYHMTLTRFNVKNCIKYQERESRTCGFLLQELAKMDFNIVQSLHNSELLQVLSWWEDLGLTGELKFARDQPVKWYMWSVATLADPRYTAERIDLTKSISLIYIMDDIFDVYGTLDQLVLFTEAINRWEVDEQLPYPMKIFLKGLYDITDEISYKILKKHGWNPNNSLRKAWARLCNAFLVEVKWFASGHMPTSEEYLKNGVISSGVHVLCSHIFFLMGQGINDGSVDLLDKVPGLVSYPATILRLWDDLGSAKDENQEGNDASYIDYYMKEHSSSTIDSAREHVFNIISNSWKKLNEEAFSPGPFSLSFRNASLNAARMVRLMYNYDGNQRLPILEKLIKSLLYERIALDDN